MNEYDTLFRFDDATGLAEVFPCEETPRPASWFVDDRTVLSPVSISPPVIGVEDGSPVYAYDPADVILPGIYAVVTTADIDEALWEMPQAIALYDRTAGMVIRQRTTNDVDLPMCLSPVWAGMPSVFVLPAATP